MFEFPYNFHPDVKRACFEPPHRCFFKVEKIVFGFLFPNVRFKCMYCKEVRVVPRSSFAATPSN